MRAAFVLGFLLVGIVVPTDLAQAQSTGQGTKQWKVEVEWLSKVNGVSFCRDAGPFYLIRGGLSAMEHASTVAHEAKHVEQYGRFKNCRAFYKTYETPRGQLELEAEAFAAGWCVQVARGADAYSLRASYLQLLLQWYVPGTSVYEAAQAFARYEDCD
jgi:hypothetical protein